MDHRSSKRMTPPSPQRLGYKPRDGDTSPASLGRKLSYAAFWASAASCMMVTRQWMRCSSIG